MGVPLDSTAISVSGREARSLAAVERDRASQPAPFGRVVTVADRPAPLGRATVAAASAATLWARSQHKIAVAARPQKP